METEVVTSGATLAAPAGRRGTACLNADGPGGRDTYALIESVLGRSAVEHNPDNDHRPVFRHIKEDRDDEVGNHFVFYAHRDLDNDGSPGDDRSRIEIKINGGAAADLRGTPGKTMTYTWRFKMNARMGFSNSFTHMFQLKSYGGNAGPPIVTITGSGTGSGENLRIDHWGDGTPTTRLAQVPMAGLKGIWLEVRVQAQISDRGTLSVTIRRPNGSTVLSAQRSGLDLWRQGEYVRGKWGIYRGKSPQLRAEEETVRFANIAISSGTPTSDCRN